MENATNSKIMKYLKGIFLSFVGVICLYLILGQFLLAHEKSIGQKE